MSLTTNKIGLIAGEGKMPLYIAQKAMQKGYSVYVIGLKGNAKEEDFSPFATCYLSLRLGQLGAGLNFFKKNDVKSIVMAGRVQHTSIFSNLMPDLRGAKFLASLKSMQTNYLLYRITEEFKKEGIIFENSAIFLEDFIPSKGILSQKKPSPEEEQIIAYGYQIAKEIAKLDIGLTCVVSHNAVIAVEGMEGTDKCILRAGELYKRNRQKNSAVAVVKVARPNQDNRYDLPVIGKGTIKSLQKAQISILAFEANKTLVLDLPEVIELANKNNICLVAV